MRGVASDRPAIPGARARAHLPAGCWALPCRQRTSRGRADSGTSPRAERLTLPPFTAETVGRKARAAEDAWNTREPERIALAYTEESVWRNRAEFLAGEHGEDMPEIQNWSWPHRTAARSGD